MGDNSAVLGYKCPCCGASIRFGHNIQMMKCDHCGNEFDLDTVKSYNDSIAGKALSLSSGKNRANKTIQKAKWRKFVPLCVDPAAAN